jgi:hypothetical protein
MLFHLTEDPGETSNRVGDHPDIVNQLREQLEAIRGAGESPR